MKRPRTTRPARENSAEEGKSRRKSSNEAGSGPRREERNVRPSRSARSFDKPETDRRREDGVSRKISERRPERSFGKNDTDNRRRPASPRKDEGSSSRSFDKARSPRRPGAGFEGKEGERSAGSRFSKPASSDRERPARGGRGHAARSKEDRPWNRKEKHEFYGDRKKGNPRKNTSAKSTAADDGLTRLNKYIANAGICSRREADEMIEAGVVSVNGEVVTTLGYKVQPGDVVRYNNSVLSGERNVYILLNKPKDFITTTDDPGERKTVMGLIAKACKERVYPVGRLDRNTTGVLLFTNDGDLARKLTHPRFEIQKIYQVELDKALKATDLAAIAEGLELEDGFIKVDEVVYAGAERNVIGVEIHSGRNRIVRRIFEHLGYVVKKLDRVVFAGLTKKDLPRGRWRFLSDMEVANLKMMTGSKKFVQGKA